MYVYSHLEDYIKDLYLSMSINKPEQLCIKDISNQLGLTIRFGNSSFRFNRIVTIKKSTKQQEWQLFGHEVCHYLRHYGNQLNMHPLFIDLQEYQANYFAYHFCVPTFMLLNLKEVNADVIVEKFNVEFDFAIRRLEMYQNRRLNIWQKDMSGIAEGTSGS